MASIREQTPALGCLLGSPPLTPETLFILFMFWSARRGLGQAVCCFAASPGGSRGQRDGVGRPRAQISFLLAVCISLHPTANRRSSWCTQRGEEEEEDQGLEGVTPVQVYVRGGGEIQIERRRDLPPLLSADGWNRLFFPECHQMTSSLMSVVKLKLHTHTHANMRRGNIVTADATPQGTKLKPDPGSYLYSLPRFTHNFTGSLGTHAIRYYL